MMADFNQGSSMMQFTTMHSDVGLVRFSLDIVARARLAIKQHRDRRRLLALSDHLLTDIGLDRSDLIRAQVASPCVLLMPVDKSSEAKFARDLW